MKVEYSPTALRQLRKLPKDKQLKALMQIEKLKTSPLAGKKLKGEFEGLYSLKVWPYRVVYRYFSAEKLLFINTIQHRQAAYKS